MSHFHIVYGMHPRGVYEHKKMGGQERRSADGEDFASSMHDLQENFKRKLHESVGKYKWRADLKRREVNFQIRDLVMAYLKNERFRKGDYNKLKLKKIGPCKILRKFSANAYELELPCDLQISPIFNVSNLYHFKESCVQTEEMISREDGSFIYWQGQLPQKGKQ